MLYPAQFEDTTTEHEVIDGDGGYVLVKDNEGFVVTFRDVPEAIIQGRNFIEAVDMAQDALRTAMEFYDEDGKPRPKPSEPRHGDVMIVFELLNKD